MCGERRCASKRSSGDTLDLSNQWEKIRWTTQRLVGALQRHIHDRQLLFSLEDTKLDLPGAHQRMQRLHVPRHQRATQVVLVED